MFVVACGTSEAAEDETDLEASDPQAAGVADHQIPAPYVSTGGSSSATATTSLDGSGLQLNGGTDPASYAIASYSIPTGAMAVTATFTVNPAPGASFTYALHGTGNGYSSRYVRVERMPGSETLQAVGASGTVICGPIVSGRPTPVTVSFDGTAQTFDVVIGGAPSACTGVPSKTKGPVWGFRVTDEATADFGGHVEFTNFALTGSP